MLQLVQFTQLLLDKMLQRSRVWSVLKVGRLLQHLLTKVIEPLYLAILDKELIFNKQDKISIHYSQFQMSYSQTLVSNMLLLWVLLLKQGQQLILDSKDNNIK